MTEKYNMEMDSMEQSIDRNHLSSINNQSLINGFSINPILHSPIQVTPPSQITRHHQNWRPFQQRWCSPPSSYHPPQSSPLPSSRRKSTPPLPHLLFTTFAKVTCSPPHLQWPVPNNAIVFKPHPIVLYFLVVI